MKIPAKMLYSILFLAVSTGNGVASTNTLSLFYKPIPSEIENVISNGLSAIQAKHICSPSEMQETEGLINAINPKFPRLDKEQRMALKTKGEKAIPAISESLLSTNVTTRLRAIIALGQLLKPHEYHNEEYKKTEKLLIALMRRCMHDNDVNVRRATSSTIAGVAREHSHSSPEDVKQALELVGKDPDAIVRRNQEIVTVDSQ